MGVPNYATPANAAAGPAAQTRLEGICVALDDLRASLSTNGVRIARLLARFEGSDGQPQANQQTPRAVPSGLHANVSQGLDDIGVLIKAQSAMIDGLEQII